MEKVQFFLDTTVDRFLNWLEHHSTHMDDPLFLQEGSYPYVVHPPRVVPPVGENGVTLARVHSTTSTKVEMNATFIAFPLSGWPPNAPRPSTMLIRSLQQREESSFVKEWFDPLERYGVWLYRAPGVMRFELLELARERMKVVMWCHNPGVREYFESLMAEVREDFPRAHVVEGGAAKRKRGPTVNTQMRGEYFRKQKQAHPEWSQTRLAMQAIKPVGEGGLGDLKINSDTVRNTYRALGLKWERANRIR